MAEITAALVKELRERTGAGMMDCKKALAENGGDIEAAIDWLRKKGLAAAAKKAGRVAAEGLVGLARRRQGRGAASRSTPRPTSSPGTRPSRSWSAASRPSWPSGEAATSSALKRQPIAGDRPTVEEEITQAIAMIGENINLRRTARVEVGQGVVAAYLHNQVRRASASSACWWRSRAPATRRARRARPADRHARGGDQPAGAAHVEDLDPAAVERERAIYADQARRRGKPEAIIEKMVEGRIRKFHEEVVLLEQAFVIEPRSA